jgi:hypothetical protein
MNACAALLALLSTIALLQPLALPILSAIRRKGPLVASAWFLLSLLPVYGMSAIVAGFIVGWEDLFRPGPYSTMRELALFGTAQEEFAGAAPILALCVIPTVLFIVLVILGRIEKRREGVVFGSLKKASCP